MGELRLLSGGSFKGSFKGSVKGAFQAHYMGKCFRGSTSVQGSGFRGLDLGCGVSDVYQGLGFRDNGSLNRFMGLFMGIELLMS